jgi:GNAT superfamily N-acetyltransferase
LKLPIRGIVSHPSEPSDGAAILADLPLARLIEDAEAANARAFSRANESVQFAGGSAVFVGVGSPLSHGVGMGLRGPVHEAEIEAIEEFFRSRGAVVSLDLCPLADAGLFESLGRRGYCITEFNNVLVKRLSAEIVMTPHVRRAGADEGELWSHTLGEGFFEKRHLTDPEMEIGRAIFEAPTSLCYMVVSESGEPAGGGGAAFHSTLATLFADSTLPQFRRLGFHRELIDARLNEAIARGCTLATASTLPGSASQRNYERAGFQVVYTKVTLTERPL